VDPSPELVQLLSQQASWSVLQARPQISELLRRAAAAAAAAAPAPAAGR
jgi:ribosomal protein L12E/L44/L45/RPP1/RPP2